MTPMRAQAALDVGQRLLVVEVVAGEQPLDGLAADPEGARRRPARPRSRGAPPGGRRGARRAPPRRRAPAAGAAPARATGTRRSSSRASSSRPWPVALEVTSTGTSSPSRSPPLAAAAAAASSGATRSALESARIRGSAASRGSCAASSRSIGRVVVDRVGAVERREVEHVHEQPRALDVGEEVVAEARRPRWRPRSARGCRRATSWRSSASSVPEHRLERRERVVGDLRRRPRQPRRAATTCRRSAARRGRRRRAA